MKYYHCPDCGRKKVIVKLRPHGEDHYACTWPDCEWFVYLISDYEVDRVEMARFDQAN